jgi:hypothetical protein
MCTLSQLRNRTHLRGWRMGIFSACCVLFFVLCCNVALLAVDINRQFGYADSEGGVATITRRSRLQLSSHYLDIIIAANALKLEVILSVLIVNRSKPVVTLGDGHRSSCIPIQSSRGSAYVKTSSSRIRLNGLRECVNQWGVVESTFSKENGHCLLSSRPVTAPEEDIMYS